MQIRVKNRNNYKKLLFILIGLLLLILSIIVLFFLQKSLNAGNLEKKQSGYSDVPSVSANNGTLIYNSVSVKVPKEGASYVIGYDWAKSDTEYPSIPSSASAYYSDDKGRLTYEILLYRDLVIPKSDSNNSVSIKSWFEDWASTSEAGVEQEPYKARNTNGFLIRTLSDDSKNKNCSYTYYFAVETNNKIEQYVLELNFYDSVSLELAENIFKSCADSISIKK